MNLPPTGGNATAYVSCAKRTNCKGVNVERPGENATFAAEKFVPRTQFRMKAKHFVTWLKNVSLSSSSRQFEITNMSDGISVSFL